MSWDIMKMEQALVSRLNIVVLSRSSETRYMPTWKVDIRQADDRDGKGALHQDQRITSDEDLKFSC
jgi:hypothetical protein